ncbi:hypothetical protein K474DRAFT_1776894 [Panus rudis PR-1116 ss-1]|nr:hypothetical protein K474DRAFT_1776894 [Panus rudis PR-1116 ss-1]
MSLGIESIPGDVIILVMHYLDAKDLAALQRVCRHFYSLIEEFGWSLALRADPRPSHTLSKSVTHWTPRQQIRYTTITDRNWQHGEFVARPLSDRWSHKLQPVLAINDSRLLLAAGNSIYSYGFIPSYDAGVAPSVRLECVYSTSNSTHPNMDITSLVCIPNDHLDRTVFVGYANGIIEHLYLPPVNQDGSNAPVPVTVLESFDYYGEEVVESLSINSTHLLTVSSSGMVTYLPYASPTSSPQFVDLNTRSWSSYLSTRSSSPFVAFGTSSANPLFVHDVLPDGMSPAPSYLLAPSNENDRPSAVYDITSAPIAAPWGGSDQIIVSGWYDGFVRVHDLRSSSRTRNDNSNAGGDSQYSLTPTLNLADPWSFEPIYSLSVGGGSSAHIAAGSARHSVLAFWDVRSPGKGWSVHAPGNDSSPVYSVVVDGPRVFGANQSRGFVLDFGPGVLEDTYPPVTIHATPTRPNARNQRQRSEDGLRRLGKGSAGFYVTKYSHARPSNC